MTKLHFTARASVLALAVALSGAAHAADMNFGIRPTTKAIPYVDQTASWTGFYAGVNAGYGFGVGGKSSGSQTDYANTSGDTGTETHGPGGPAWASKSDMGGFVGGGQIGYNRQIGRLVLGAEADFQGGDISTSSSSSDTTKIKLLPAPPGGANLWPVSGTADATAKVNWYGTVRGRVGMTTPDNSLLVYGTGGLAYGSVDHTFGYTGGFLPDAALGFGGSHWAGTTSSSQTKVGWTAGAGAEWMIPNSKWSLKAEYLYTDLGSTTLDLSAPAFRNSNGTGGRTVSATNRTDDSFQTVRAGLNYHF